MNSLNSSSLKVRAGIAITGAEREGKIGTVASGVDKAGAGTLANVVALELTNGRVVVLGSGEAGC